MARTELDDLIATPISEAIPDSFLVPYLASAPWHSISGTFNFRSVSYAPLVKENFIYRGGSLSFLGENGKNALKSLGIKVVFDLRSAEERTAGAEPDFSFARSVSVESQQCTDPTLQDVESYKSPEHRDRTRSILCNHELLTVCGQLEEYYLSILETHRAFIRAVLSHVLLHPKEPFLVHCTIGKDRTAVVVAVILCLAGVPHHAVVYDYALSRIGLEPARLQLEAKLAAGSGGQVDWDSPEVRMIAGCQAETMTTFLQTLIQSHQDSVEGYVIQKLGFNADEVHTIRLNLSEESSHASKA